MAIVNVILADDPRSFNYLALPEVPSSVVGYINDNIANISTRLTDAGRSFMQSASEQYALINNSAAINAARMVLRKTVGKRQPNAIYEMDTIEEVRNAQGIMQRYMMAEPSIRKAYHNQRIDGYSDSYIDNFPLAFADSHYDYRRVMDGMIVINNDHWVMNSYIHDTLDGEVDELTLDNKVDIINTWELARICLEAGEDPTDILA